MRASLDDLTAEERNEVLRAARCGCLAAIGMTVTRARNRLINPNVDVRRFVDIIIRADRAAPSKVTSLMKGQGAYCWMQETAPVGEGACRCSPLPGQRLSPTLIRQILDSKPSRSMSREKFEIWLDSLDTN